MKFPICPIGTHRPDLVCNTFATHFQFHASLVAATALEWDDGGPGGSGLHDLLAGLLQQRRELLLGTRQGVGVALQGEGVAGVTGMLSDRLEVRPKLDQQGDVVVPEVVGPEARRGDRPRLAAGLMILALKVSRFTRLPSMFKNRGSWDRVQDLWPGHVPTVAQRRTPGCRACAFRRPSSPALQRSGTGGHPEREPGRRCA